jgi:hypothetical protein
VRPRDVSGIAGVRAPEKTAVEGAAVAARSAAGGTPEWARRVLEFE